ncbi:Uncharacterised protein [Mycobacteroides abscessus]|nr:Uncharacterised protein [Mycobacteroides abscessus]
MGKRCVDADFLAGVDDVLGSGVHHFEHGDVLDAADLGRRGELYEEFLHRIHELHRVSDIALGVAAGAFDHGQCLFEGQHDGMQQGQSRLVVHLGEAVVGSDVVHRAQRVE